MQCLVLALCDDVIEDRRTGKKSLIGMFDSLVAPSLPARREMYLVLSLAARGALLPLTVRLSGPTGAEVLLLELQPPLQQPSGSSAAQDIVLDLSSVDFDQTGVYQIQLWSAAGLLAERRFEVTLQDPAPEAAAIRD